MSLSKPPRREGTRTSLLTEHALSCYCRREGSACGPAVMVGPNFRLLLTVIILQFKNHTNTESSLPLLRVCHLEEACEGEFLGGQWNSSSYRPASLTGKTVRGKQYTEESVLWPHPKAPLCTARALLHSRESLKD